MEALMDKRKAKPAPADDSVEVVLVAKMRWDGDYPPLGTVLRMSAAQAADLIAMNFVRPRAPQAA
jgi:hypothetical protein